MVPPPPNETKDSKKDVCRYCADKRHGHFTPHVAPTPLLSQPTPDEDANTDETSSSLDKALLLSPSTVHGLNGCCAARSFSCFRLLSSHHPLLFPSLSEKGFRTVSPSTVRCTAPGRTPNACASRSRCSSIRCWAMSLSSRCLPRPRTRTGPCARRMRWLVLGTNVHGSISVTSCFCRSARIFMWKTGRGHTVSYACYRGRSVKLKTSREISWRTRNMAIFKVYQ